VGNGGSQQVGLGHKREAARVGEQIVAHQALERGSSWKSATVARRQFPIACVGARANGDDPIISCAELAISDRAVPEEMQPHELIKGVIEQLIESDAEGLRGGKQGRVPAPARGALRAFALRLVATGLDVFPLDQIQAAPSARASKDDCVGARAMRTT
jgi:hypothetical protein